MKVECNYSQTNKLDAVDKTRKCYVAIISVLLLLSSILKMQALASDIMAYKLCVLPALKIKTSEFSQVWFL